MSNSIKGLMLALGSAVLFGLSPVFCKFAFESGTNPMTISFLRSIISIPMILVVIWLAKIPVKISKVAFRDLIVIGFFGVTLTAVTLSSSYMYISSGLATTLHFIYPALTALLGAIIWKQKLNKLSYIALATVTIGVILFSWNTTSVGFLGVILALISGVTYTFYILLLEHSQLKNVNAWLITLGTCVVMAISIGAYGFLSNSFLFDMEPIGWAYTITNGICTALAAVLFQIGVKKAGSTTASMACAFEPVTSVVCGVIIFADPIYFEEIFGCLLVCIGVVVLIFGKKKSSPALM